MDLQAMLPIIIVAFVICLAVGEVIKKMQKIPNQLIPIIILFIGIVAGFLPYKFEMTYLYESIVGGFLGGAVSVFGFEIIKQTYEFYIKLKELGIFKQQVK